MKLIKISQDHYVIVDDSDIKEGDWLYSFDNGLIVQANKGSADTINSKSLNGRGYGKITHSTQPLDCNCSNRGYKLDTNCAERNHCFGKVQYLPVQEVKELLGEVDVKKKAYRFRRDYQDSFEWMNECIMNDAIHRQEGFIAGYNQSLEDNKGKVYTEEDLFNAIGVAIGLWSPTYASFEEGWKLKILQSLQPKTEWEVELIDGQLKQKQ